MLETVETDRAVEAVETQEIHETCMTYQTVEDREKP
ncbi:hypothetical protein GA0115240_11287 [Streptomyces sp. DvalAA-14]|nr:hypothetical protein GA0115240_11287 [Streptomyces sp. DvalAA-14]